MHTSTAKVQKNIHFFSISALLLSIAIVAAVCIYPFYSNQRKIEKRDLSFARDTTVLIVDEYMTRIKEVSLQVSSRTKARMLLEDWVTSKVNRKKDETFIRKILNGALKNNDQLIGITRVDSSGNIVTSVGKPLNRKFYPKSFAQVELQIIGPFIKNKHQYISIASPIFSENNRQIGSDISLYDITSLQSAIHQKLQNRLGEILIAYVESDMLHIFSPIDSPWKSQITSDKSLANSLLVAIKEKRVGDFLTVLDNNELFISYSPLFSVPNWGVAVIIKKAVLYASIQSILFFVGIAVVALSIILALCLNLILKPLAGRILMHTHELEESIVSSQKKLQLANEQLEQFALYDYLTGVLNRRGFEQAFGQELSRAKRTNVSFALFFIDINDFKFLNDTYGHEAGDLVLKDTASRLKAFMRNEDSIGRIGGDEFLILAPNVETENIELILSKLQGLDGIPHSYNGVTINSSVSIGAATYESEHDTINTMLSRADALMYKAKKNKPLSD